MDIENQLADSRTRGILSSLWVFYFVNHFFMGLHEFANPAFVEQLLGGFDVSDTLLLIAAITIEVPIAMIVLSRVLPNRINWIVNIVVAVYAVGLEFINNRNPDLDNVFFLLAELAGFVTIIVVSIRWRRRQTREATA
jgi:hypothetical protein